MFNEDTAIDLDKFTLRESYSKKTCKLTSNSKIILGNTYFKQNIPGTHRDMFLREETYKAVLEASQKLPKFYSFYVFDAYRSLETQIFMFESFKEEIKKRKPQLSATNLLEETLKFVPHPELSTKLQSMPHNSGGAIDLSLCFKARLVDFGSEFDEATQRSSSTYYETAKKREDIIFRNRRRFLTRIMQEHGFVAHPDEWWHFNIGNESWSEVTKKPPIFLSMEGRENELIA